MTQYNIISVYYEIITGVERAVKSLMSPQWELCMCVHLEVGNTITRVVAGESYFVNV